jgi:methylenetetrahydrofolate reductase (NADPH)
MRIVEALRARRPFFSFEFSPPRSDEAARALMQTAATLRALDPLYVSVTYGAGGSTRVRTVETAVNMQRDLGLDVCAHVTCVGSSRADLRKLLDELRDSGITNVMALRGDPPKGETAFVPAEDGLRTSRELVEFMRAGYDFCIGAGAYPETHPEAPDAYTDLLRLKAKVDAGVDFLVTQLFFDNDGYFDFVARARDIGIEVPIVPGVMPIGNYAQINRFTQAIGATIPARLRAALDDRKDDPAAVADLGVSYATLQCADLLARGAPGVHFYTLNSSPATRAVVSALLTTRFGAVPARP